MTHQPPLPNAATSPYPLHPAPIPEEQKIAAAAATAERNKPAPESGMSNTAIGAALGLGAVAAVTGLFYARRRSRKAIAAAKPKRRSDDKAKRGRADRSRVASSQPYEVSYFARKHKISSADARAILQESGPDRDAANALAIKRKAA